MAFTIDAKRMELFVNRTGTPQDSAELVADSLDDHNPLGP